MKKIDKEFLSGFNDVITSCIYCITLMGAVVFTVFVWLSCHHLEEILEFLKSKCW